MAQSFFYSKQIRRFLTQFARIFSNFYVEGGVDDTGKPILVSVPIRYGDASRQATTILQENSANNLPCAPLMTFHINSLTYRRRDVQEPYFVDKKYIRQRQWDEASQSYLETQGNAFMVERHMPVPYELGITLDIWTTNTESKLQLFEQILPLFNPALEIQSTDNYLDWTSLSAIELDSNIQFQSRQISQNDTSTIDIASLKFRLPIWITMPARVTKEGVIHKIIATMYNDSGDLVNAIAEDDILLGNRLKISPHGYQLLLLGDKLQVLSAATPSDQYNNDLASNNLLDSPLSWRQVLVEYGKIRNGISLIHIEYPDGEISGTIAIDENDESLLNFSIDPDTLPQNTLDPIDAVINPLNSSPDNGLPTAVSGQRYLLTESIGDSSDTESTAAWFTTSELVANANDIIEYDGSEWQVVFNADTTTTTEYLTNIKTGIQYKWTTTDWVRSYEGIYDGGSWRITI